MDRRIIVGLVVLFVVVILGAILVAAPGPNDQKMFSSRNVKVLRPSIGGVVVKNFTAVGEARGTWYFEASFPVEVRDPSNKIIGHGVAQAEGNWMTEDFVPFSAPIKIEGYTGPATLVFLKDNPSGLPEKDDAVLFPIVVE